MNIFKYKLTALITCSFFFHSVNAQWSFYSDATGKFSVTTPGPLNEKISKIKTGLGELEYHTFFYRPEEAKPDNVFYVINYCDYPKGAFPKDSTDLIKDFFSTTIESSVQSVHGSLTYQDDIYELGCPGKIWRVSYNHDHAIIKSKCFLADNRFYLIQTMTVKEKSMNTSADKFLNSFRFGA